jgi:bifunctional non-homologous end joining protein LigD
MASIATPVTWAELKTIPSASAFTLKDMAARLAQPDPWADYATCTVQITKAARAKLGL